MYTYIYIYIFERQNVYSYSSFFRFCFFCMTTFFFCPTNYIVLSNKKKLFAALDKVNYWRPLGTEKPRGKVWRNIGERWFDYYFNLLNYEMLLRIPLIVRTITRPLIIHESYDQELAVFKSHEMWLNLGKPNTTQLSESTGRGWIGSRESLGLMNYIQSYRNNFWYRLLLT